MKKSLLGATFGVAAFALSPSAAWAQHGGHSSGQHGHSQSASVRSHAHFHAPPYDLLRGRGYPYAGYPYEYFAPGGYLDPYRSPALPYLDRSSAPANSYSTAAEMAAPDVHTVSPAQKTALRISEVRLQITPRTAAVFMDGANVGAANDYSGSTRLALESGRHHFEFRAEGCQPLAFDLDVPPGRTIVVERALPPGNADRR